jgi:hypothetical protein
MLFFEQEQISPQPEGGRPGAISRWFYPPLDIIAVEFGYVKLLRLMMIISSSLTSPQTLYQQARPRFLEQVVAMLNYFRIFLEWREQRNQQDIG